jgi:predicted transcriptional regulator of viral defense system
MKSKSNLLEQLTSIPHFDKKTIYQLGKQLGLQDSTVDTYISRFLKNKDIYRLKNGVYVSAKFFNHQKDDLSYPFYLANILRTPSYISSWTALQYYGLTTEIIHTVTSVTLKVTKDYQTKAGTFAYQSINPRLFSDFSLVTESFPFFIASPAKALFDLLYFRTRQFRSFPRTPSKKRKTTIKMMVEELRIDLDEMTKEEQKKFDTLIELI